MVIDDGRKRVVIDYVGPQVDGGRFPIKRAVGETVKVVAHAFADGHDPIRMEVLYRKQDQSEWTVREMEYEVNDEWSGSVCRRRAGRVCLHGSRLGGPLRHLAERPPEEIRSGPGCRHRVEDRRRPAPGHGPARRARRCDEAGRMGGTLRNSRRTRSRGRSRVGRWVGRHHAPLSGQVAGHDVPHGAGRDRGPAPGGLQHVVRVVSPLPRPRSAGTAHSTTASDCCRRSRGWASTCSICRPSTRSARPHRKGRNNSTTAGPNDPGSPWAIGSSLGGHKAIHPELGTLEDFQRLVRRAARARAGDRDGPGVSVLARSSVRDRASRVVPLAARRDGPVRREPAEEISGHPSAEFRDRAVAGIVGGAQERGPVLDRPGRPHLPRRQPAHQALRLLGVAHRRGPAGLSRT